MSERIIEKVDQLSNENISLKKFVKYNEENLVSPKQLYSDVLKTNSSFITKSNSSQKTTVQSSNIFNKLDQRIDHLEQEGLSCAAVIQGSIVTSVLADSVTRASDVGASGSGGGESGDADSGIAPPAAPSAGASVSAVTTVNSSTVRRLVSERLNQICDDGLDADVASVHVIGNEKKHLKVFFSSKNQRDSVLKVVKKKKPEDMFISEYLTRTRSQLFYQIRCLKKVNFSIEHVYVRNGGIVCKVVGSDKHVIVSSDDHFQLLKSSITAQ